MFSLNTNLKFLKVKYSFIVNNSRYIKKLIYTYFLDQNNNVQLENNLNVNEETRAKTGDIPFGIKLNRALPQSNKENPHIPQNENLVAYNLNVNVKERIAFIEKFKANKTH